VSRDEVIDVGGEFAGNIDSEATRPSFTDHAVSLKKGMSAIFSEKHRIIPQFA